MDSSITITYDSSNPNARLAVKFIKTLECLKVSKTVTSESDKEAEKIMKEYKDALDRADDDIKAGRVYKAKNARDLIEQCLK